MVPGYVGGDSRGDNTVRHLDLFSGIGGFALACEWAGIETVGFVEIDKYCQQVLKNHWPDVPIVGDIRDVTETTFANAAGTTRRKETEAGLDMARNILSQTRRHEDTDRLGQSCDASTGTTTPIKSSIDLITGGFPCQPFSVAGKRQGDRDDRYLWPEMLRVIEIYKPTWVLGENVAGIVSMALDTVLSDLENAGYEVQAFVIPACAVNAWHRRDRVWIVAHSKGTGLERSVPTGNIRTGGLSTELCEVNADSEGNNARGLPIREIETESGLKRCGQYVEDPKLNGLEKQRDGGISRGQGNPITDSSWWSVEPELGRVAHGIPHRVDRLKALGNAIVPQVAYQILKGIVNVEKT